MRIRLGPPPGGLPANAYANKTPSTTCSVANAAPWDGFTGPIFAQAKGGGGGVCTNEMVSLEINSSPGYFSRIHCNALRWRSPCCCRREEKQNTLIVFCPSGGVLSFACYTVRAAADVPRDTQTLAITPPTDHWQIICRPSTHH